ncbi:hypothetical protein [Halosimplex salinum]|uniref:hypothetical protein n=1 Tax=Halosimplex salinum TaxID=1710538 RepID=UPI000F480957|nr:hypothetical protein [Halosimplex salinum]
MPLQLPILDAAGGDPASLLAFVLALPTAIVAARLAARTRFFEERESAPETWHGRPPSQADRETYGGFNPFFVLVVAFFGSTLVYLAIIEVLFLG